MLDSLNQRNRVKGLHFGVRDDEGYLYTDMKN